MPHGDTSFGLLHTEKVCTVQGTQESWLRHQFYDSTCQGVTGETSSCFSPGAMDAVELARRLQEEATCSICLDYFSDPVMTACGHNFCRECIQMSWEKGKGKKGKRKQKGSFPCPECREMSPQRNLRPNRLLTKVAEMARQHPGLQKRDLCQAHQEPLKLFCQDDQIPICVVCRESQEHRLHRVLPVDEAAKEYKVNNKLRGFHVQEEPWSVNTGEV